MRKQPDPAAWFMCKYCKQCIQGADNFIRHKKEEHTNLYWEDRRFHEENLQRKTPRTPVTAPLSPIIDESEIRNTATPKTCCCKCNCSKKNNYKDELDSEEVFFGDFGNKNDGRRPGSGIKGEQSDDPDVLCLGVLMNDGHPEPAPTVHVSPREVIRPQKKNPVLQPRSSISSNSYTLSGGPSKTTRYPLLRSPSPEDFDLPIDDDEIVNPGQLSPSTHDLDYPEDTHRYTAHGIPDSSPPHATASTYIPTCRNRQDARLTNSPRLSSRPSRDFELPCSSRNLLSRTLPNAGSHSNFTSGHDPPMRRAESVSCLGFTAPTGHSSPPAAHSIPKTLHSIRQRHNLEAASKSYELDVSIDPSEVWSSKIPDDNLLIEDYSSPPPDSDESSDSCLIDQTERISLSEAQRLSLPRSSSKPAPSVTETGSDPPQFTDVAPIKIRNISCLQSDTPVISNVSQQAPGPLPRTGLELIMNNYEGDDDENSSSSEDLSSCKSFPVKSPVRERTSSTSSSITSSETSLLRNKDASVNGKRTTIVNAEPAQTPESIAIRTVRDMLQTSSSEGKSKPEQTNSENCHEFTVKVPKDANLLTLTKLLLEIVQAQRTEQSDDQDDYKEDSLTQKANQESTASEHKDFEPKEHSDSDSQVQCQSATDGKSSVSAVNSSNSHLSSKIKGSEGVSYETLRNATSATVPTTIPQSVTCHGVSSKLSAKSVTGETMPVKDIPEPHRPEVAPSESTSEAQASDHTTSNPTPEPSIPKPLLATTGPKPIVAFAVPEPTVTEAIAEPKIPELEQPEPLQANSAPNSIVTDAVPEPRIPELEQSRTLLATTVSEPIVFETMPEPKIPEPNDSIPVVPIPNIRIPICNSGSSPSIPEPMPTDSTPAPRIPQHTFIESDSAAQSSTHQPILSYSTSETNILKPITTESEPAASQAIAIDSGSHPQSDSSSTAVNPVPADLDSSFSEEPPEPNSSEAADLDSSFSEHDYTESRSSEPSPVKDTSSIPIPRPSYWFDDIPREGAIYAGVKEIEKLIQVLDTNPPSPPISQPLTASTASDPACSTPEPEIPYTTQEQPQATAAPRILKDFLTDDSPQVFSEAFVPESFPDVQSAPATNLDHELQPEVPDADTLAQPQVTTTLPEDHTALHQPLPVTESPRKKSRSSNNNIKSPPLQHHLNNTRASNKRLHGETQNKQSLKPSPKSSSNQIQTTDLTSPRPKRKCTKEITYSLTSRKKHSETTPSTASPLAPGTGSAKSSKLNGVAIKAELDYSRLTSLDLHKLPQVTVFLDRCDRSIDKFASDQTISRKRRRCGPLTEIQSTDSPSKSSTDSPCVDSTEIKIFSETVSPSSQLLQNPTQVQPEEHRNYAEFPPALVKPGVFRHYRRQERRLYKAQLAKSPKRKITPSWQAPTFLDVAFPNISKRKAIFSCSAYKAAPALVAPSWQRSQSLTIQPEPTQTQLLKKQVDPPKPVSSRRHSLPLSVQPYPPPSQNILTKRPATPVQQPPKSITVSKRTQANPKRALKKSNQVTPSHRLQSSSLRRRPNQPHSLRPRSLNKGPLACTLPCCRSFAAQTEIKRVKQKQTLTISKTKTVQLHQVTGNPLKSKVQHQLHIKVQPTPLNQRHLLYSNSIQCHLSTSKKNYLPSLQPSPDKIAGDLTVLLKKTTSNNIPRSQSRFHRRNTVYPPPPVLVKCEVVATTDDDPIPESLDPFFQPRSPPDEEPPKLIQQIYPCRFCRQRFDTKQSLMKHEFKHVLDKPFKCRFCETSFSMSQQCSRHERISHPEVTKRSVPQNIFFCIWCDSVFPNEDSLKLHEETHPETKPCLCGTCPPRKTKSATSLDHDYISSPIDPGRPCESHVCAKCLRGSQRCTEVEVADIPFHCRYCPVILPSEQVRILHELNLHSYRGQRNKLPGFPCSSCGKSYNIDILRTLHERMHQT